MALAAQQSIIAAQPPDLIVTDLDMAVMSGYDLCQRIKSERKTRLIPVLIISGQHSLESRLRVWELGADDFLSKPFDIVEVRARCQSLLRMKRLIDELDSAETVVFAFARAVEAKCRYTWGHSERVYRYAMDLAAKLKLSDAEMTTLGKGAYLHDIGKIYVPETLLNKPGPLTDEEAKVVRQHPSEGTRIVAPLRSIQDVIPLIRWHHERIDGGGYPDGLLGDQIPLLVRILSVADVYDALSSERPYRSALPHGECLRMLKEDAQTGALDPSLVNIFSETPSR